MIKVGQISEIEKKAIFKLNYKKAMQFSLLKMDFTADKINLIDNILMDYNKTVQEINEVWCNLAQKYHWEPRENGCWKLNYETNDIFWVE